MQDEPKKKDRFRSEMPLSGAMGPVLFLTFIFFLLFVVRQIAGPMLPAMEADLTLSHTQSGLFILCMGAGFFISQIGAAFLAAKLGYRRCIFLALLGSAGASAALAYTNAAGLLYLAFAALGMTGGLYVPSGIALITVIVQPRDWGKAMGIHEIAPNLALIAVPFIATAVVTLLSWRLGYFCMAGALSLTGIAYLFAGIDSRMRPSPPDVRRVREIISNPSFWSISLLLSLAVAVETGVYAMIPLFLVNERAFSLEDANQLLGLSRIPGIIMVILSGWMTDRLNPSATISFALGLTGATVIVLAVCPAWMLPPAIFFQSAAAACLFPPILAMTSIVSSTENRALMLSLSLAIAPVVGGGLVPAAIALAGDVSSFGNGLVGAGILTIAGIGLVRR